MLGIALISVILSNTVTLRGNYSLKIWSMELYIQYKTLTFSSIFKDVNMEHKRLLPSFTNSFKQLILVHLF